MTSKCALRICVFLLLASQLFSQEPTFRDPFTLKLPVDKNHYYEEHFDKIPYVIKNDVYLFSKERFGVNVRVTDEEIAEVIYQPDLTKADIEFDFKADSSNRSTMMLLTIKNRLKKRVYLNGLMTVPGKKGIYPTSLLPVEAGLQNFESWPHPIVQLVVRNLRFAP